MNRYTIAAILFTISVWLAYFIQFKVNLGLPFSDKTEVWGQFGDFIGGVLNPTLGFVSIVLLLKSLTYQKTANDNLRTEINLIRQTEKLKSFESQFFNMLDSQKQVFDSFTIELNQANNSVVLRSADAVITLERTITHLKGNGKTDLEIGDFLKDSDEKDRMFGMIRTFYILVKITIEHLSDKNGFTEADRESHLSTLVNFTDFHLLRLILISKQFLDYDNVKYLNNCQELNNVFSEMKLTAKY
ncbi:hypothetical protein [Pseudoalteromonas sp. SR43-5]|uniref:hypothetical protein n=1 Tax=Pseudoalteromonas sp. SR43-5 TaxID=2760941 RepID=UPI0015F89C8E|nr:hypothetical protein [Pseudoalteromonas sp. SR43-5]MBB1306205.1 hypothetical protein [Pseudoalteromonas sp. SR43-5]